MVAGSAYVIEQSAYFGYGNLVIARANGSFVRSLDQKAGRNADRASGIPRALLTASIWRLSSTRPTSARLPCR